MAVLQLRLGLWLGLGLGLLGDDEGVVVGVGDGNGGLLHYGLHMHGGVGLRLHLHRCRHGHLDGSLQRYVMYGLPHLDTRAVEPNCACFLLTDGDAGGIGVLTLRNVRFDSYLYILLGEAPASVFADLGDVDLVMADSADWLYLAHVEGGGRLLVFALLGRCQQTPMVGIAAAEVADASSSAVDCRQVGIGVDLDDASGLAVGPVRTMLKTDWQNLHAGTVLPVAVRLRLQRDAVGVRQSRGVWWAWLGLLRRWGDEVGHVVGGKARVGRLVRRGVEGEAGGGREGVGGVRGEGTVGRGQEISGSHQRVVH